MVDKPVEQKKKTPPLEREGGTRIGKRLGVTTEGERKEEGVFVTIAAERTKIALSGTGKKSTASTREKNRLLKGVGAGYSSVKRRKQQLAGKGGGKLHWPGGGAQKRQKEGRKKK